MKSVVIIEKIGQFLFDFQCCTKKICGDACTAVFYVLVIRETNVQILIKLSKVCVAESTKALLCHN